MKFPEILANKLTQRDQSNSLRFLSRNNNAVDFYSNDYLGFASNLDIFNASHQYLNANQFSKNGSTGSRLISGNIPIFEITENFIANFHQSSAALIYNSGYDANVGILSCVPQKRDLILYDELAHASIRDGILLSLAKSYKFKHNDYEDLNALLDKFHHAYENIYIVTESVFSMDGDSPLFEEIISIAQKYNAYIIVDEAHGLGVFGERGEGILQNNQLHQHIFARIITFGKALGCHGAAVLGSDDLKKYLINFSRSFIYTTAMSPHNVSTILMSYHQLDSFDSSIKLLKNNINYFNQQIKLLGLTPMFIRSKSAIHSAIIPGNQNAKQVAEILNQINFNVKAILSPTVPKGQERLRICLHSYNTFEQIDQMLQLLSQIIFK